MIRIIEAFSGIGSQSKALQNLGVEYEVISTIEWDVHAIYAYDLIHNGVQMNNKYNDWSKDQLVDFLSKRGLSYNGKTPMTKQTLKILNVDFLRRLAYAIDRTKNLSNIAEVSANDLKTEVDIFTYSFPCQDLSICSFWRGNTTGIDRNYKNRSNMLWEVERILHEMREVQFALPKILLMENVSSIESPHHSKNFEYWKDYLADIGYVNRVFHLNAVNFGIPQNRKRAFMVSVFVGKNETLKQIVQEYFENCKLEDKSIKPLKPLNEFLRTNYSNRTYFHEANQSNPNDTPSRQKIFELNSLIYSEGEMLTKTVNTITTKQDRHPNSGLISFKSEIEGKSSYRNLTPRECFLLMGFNENDFDILSKYNPLIKSNSRLFTREKLIRLAGNSIVVPVIEEVFIHILELLKIVEQEM
jgi:DNA (cytosine-5)-methyltransferase 1